MKNKYYFGIDIGGTVTKIGLVDGNANIEEKVTFPTAMYNSKRKLLRKVIECMDEISQKDSAIRKHLSGIGIGIAGLVDFERGVIHKITNIKGWKNVEIAKILRKETNLPVLVDNDVNVVTLAEFIFGSGRGARNMICLTLGTGVGGGLVVEGKLYRGSSHSAGEIGHFPIRENGPRCNCGSRGCLERYIGNKYFASRVIQKIKKTGGGRKILKLADGKFSNVNPKIIAQAAREGDKLAVEAWYEFASYLGLVIAGLVNVFNPDVIVIGGGVAEAGRVLLDPLKKIARRFTLSVPQRTVKIRKAAFKDESGIIGAAALFNTLEKPA